MVLYLSSPCIFLWGGGVGERQTNHPPTQGLNIVINLLQSKPISRPQKPQTMIIHLLAHKQGLWVTSKSNNLNKARKSRKEKNRMAAVWFDFGSCAGRFEWFRFAVRTVPPGERLALCFYTV